MDVQTSICLETFNQHGADLSCRLGPLVQVVLKSPCTVKRTPVEQATFGLTSCPQNTHLDGADMQGRHGERLSADHRLTQSRQGFYCEGLHGEDLPTPCAV